MSFILVAQPTLADDATETVPNKSLPNKSQVDLVQLGFDGRYPYPIPASAQVLVRVAPSDLESVGNPDLVDYRDQSQLVNRFTYTAPYGLAGSGLNGQWSVPLLFKFNEPNRRSEWPIFLQQPFNFDFGGGEDVTRIHGWRWWFFQSQHCEVVASRKAVVGAFQTKLSHLTNCSNPGQEPSCTTTESDVWVMLVRYLAATEAIHDKNGRNLPDEFLRFPRVAVRRYDEEVVDGKVLPRDRLSRKKNNFGKVMANHCGYFAGGPTSNDPRYMNPHYITVLLTDETDLNGILSEKNDGDVEMLESTFDEWTDLWTMLYEQDLKYEDLISNEAFKNANAASQWSLSHQAEREALRWINRDNYNLSWMHEAHWLQVTIPKQKGWDKGLFR